MGARQRERGDRRAGAAPDGDARASATASAPPADGVQAEVVVVHSFDELDASGAAGARAHRALQRAVHELRRDGALPLDGPSRAARLGAVAMLVRAVGPTGLRTPHTGALQYATDAPKIPAAAITTEDADRLQRMADRGSRVVVRLKMEAHFEADAESANVVGEIRGREKPDEIVVVSGHLDSWDVGAGATDDGGGCVVTWEALRHHEEAEPAAAAHGARRAVDQRGERRPRRPRLSRSASRRARRST